MDFLFFTIKMWGKGGEMGRNLDFEHTFGETVTITPRNFNFKL